MKFIRIDLKYIDNR